MKFKELNALSVTELDEKLQTLTMELLKVNGQIAQGSGIKNTSQRSNLKKTIAKIKTIKTQRQKEK